MFWTRNKENSFPIRTLIWRPAPDSRYEIMAKNGILITKMELKLVAYVDFIDILSNLVNLKPLGLEVLFRTISRSNYREVDMKIYVLHKQF